MSSTLNTLNTPQDTKLDYKGDASMHINFLVKDVALKSLLFGMVFYIINSNLMNKLLSCLDKYPWIEKNLIQAILFAIIFYLISVNL
jgi:hypothetical protein